MAVRTIVNAEDDDPLGRLTNHVNRELGVAEDLPLIERVRNLETRFKGIPVAGAPMNVEVWRRLNQDDNAIWMIALTLTLVGLAIYRLTNGQSILEEILAKLDKA